MKETENEFLISNFFLWPFRVECFLIERLFRVFDSSFQFISGASKDSPVVFSLSLMSKVTMFALLLEI